MDKNVDRGKVMFKAGLFIILSVALLIFSILWLRYFSITPDKIITVKFQKTGPISMGLPVYYQGVDIGKVTNIGFSSNYRDTLVELSIYKKGICLPENVYAEIDMEGITGQNYVNIIYPDDPSCFPLRNHSTIEGRPSDLAQAREVLSEFVKSGQFERTFKRLNDAIANISKASSQMNTLFSISEDILKSNRGDVRSFFHNAALSADNAKLTTASLRDVFASPDIKSTVNNMSSGSKRLGGIINNINKITVDVDKVTGNPRFQEGIIRTIEQTGNFAESLNTGDLKCMINSTLNNADKTLNDIDRTVNRYDCMGQNVNDLMAQRFLLIKLMFGKPGQNFQKCNNLNCLQQQVSK